jgi:hypothetical protein
VLAAFALGLSARREFAAEICGNNRAAWRFKIRFFAAGQARSTQPAPPLCKQGVTIRFNATVVAPTGRSWKPRPSGPSDSSVGYLLTTRVTFAERPANAKASFSAVANDGQESSTRVD